MDYPDESERDYNIMALDKVGFAFEHGEFYIDEEHRFKKAE